MHKFCTKKGIRRVFSNARTPQQNGVAERRNRTLIKAARTMLADAKSLGKFDAKGEEGYFVRYSMSSKAFRVFNKRTKKVEENMHVDFLENKLIEKGVGPNWLFDIDSLTNSMNYVPVVVAGTSSTNISSTKDVASQAVKKDVSSLRYIAFPNWFHDAHMETRNSDGCNTNDPKSSGISNSTATLKVPSAEQVEPAVTLTVETKIPTVSSPVPTVCLDISPESSSDPRIISKGVFSHEETPSLGNALTLSNSNFIMKKLAFCDYHNMITILEKTEHNIDFHQIVDFLEASHVRYALTISPTVYVSHIRQFWSTARVETTNLETKILATVDGKPMTISESSLRRHLKLNDEEGIGSLPDIELFENLSLMGYNILLNQ
uniref:Putative ribonuclease H-like domain-containing protein n=1 Tax=Tanacetum cinerariifolium TaxID=118510 RepID=A0A699J970_TANCI|nr:putative ribonuclease H-like domain-containing protein [Tanacetum cinerariifolium]